MVRSVGPQADPPRELAGFLLGATVAVCVYRLGWGSVCPLSAQSKLGQPARHGQSCSDHQLAGRCASSAQEVVTITKQAHDSTLLVVHAVLCC